MTGDERAAAPAGGGAADAALPEAPSADPSAEAIDGEEAVRHVPYEVTLPSFTGPLELLLHLIKKHKLDILDIPVGFITSRYLEYLDVMREINLDVAAEYLEMAATLVRIKSKMLLPTDEQVDDEGNAAEPEDPRAELVRRLLEYRKYRDAADQLVQRQTLHRDVFVRDPEPGPSAADRPLGAIGIGALLDAFAGVLRRLSPEVAHEVVGERVSVAQRIHDLVDLLRERRRVRFEQLFEGARTRGDLVVTFLALLEMTKLHLLRLEQAGPDTPLLLEYVGGDGDLGDLQVTSDEPPPGTDAAPPDAEAAASVDPAEATGEGGGDDGDRPLDGEAPKDDHPAAAPDEGPADDPEETEE